MKKIIFLFIITYILPIISMDRDTKAFFDAVEAGDLTTVKKLIANHAIKNVSIQNNDGDTVLMIAVKKNNIPMILELSHLLIRSDLKNKSGQTAFTLAMDAENPEMIVTLLNNVKIQPNIDNQVDKEGNTLLMLAIKKRNIDIIKAILNQIPDISSKTMKLAQALPEKLESEKILKNEIIKLLNDAQNQYILYEEMTKPNPNMSVIHTILTPSFKILNTPSPTRNLLFITLDNDNKDLIDLFIAHGADVNQLLRDGKIPLIIAVEKRATDIVKKLLRAGADPLMENQEGYTALKAVQKKLNDKRVQDEARAEYEKINSYLKHVIPNRQEKEMFQAIEKGNIEEIKKFIDEGADIFKQFNYNRKFVNPVRVALNSKNPAVITLFRDTIKSVLFKSIEEDNVDNLKKLIPNFFSAQAVLDLAIKASNLKAVTTILNTFGPKIDINKKNKDGNTPLIVAIQKASPEIVEFLLQKGAKSDIAAANDTTPLILAKRLAQAESPKKENYKTILNFLQPIATAPIIPSKKPAQPTTSITPSTPSAPTPTPTSATVSTPTSASLATPASATPTSATSTEQSWFSWLQKLIRQ